MDLRCVNLHSLSLHCCLNFPKGLGAILLGLHDDSNVISFFQMNTVRGFFPPFHIYLRVQETSSFKITLIDMIVYWLKLLLIKVLLNGAVFCPSSHLKARE